jgi:hypothetical protein
MFSYDIYGTGYSDLVKPDFGSLAGGVHHMRDPPVNDPKSAKVRVRKVRGSGSDIYMIFAIVDSFF